MIQHPDIEIIQKYGELPRPRKGKTLICGWCETTRLYEGSGQRYIWHGGYIICGKCYKDYVVDYFSKFWLEA